MKPGAPRLDDQLCFALYTASRLVVRAYRPALDPLGLTYPQYLVLLVLWERDDLGEPPPAVGELGDRLRLDSGTLTPLLKRMEEQGLLTRERSGEDERVVRVVLAAPGRALATPACAVPARLVGENAPPEALQRIGHLRDELVALVALLEARGDA